MKNASLASRRIARGAFTRKPVGKVVTGALDEIADAKGLGIRASSSINEFDPRGLPATGPIDVVDLFCGCGGLSLGFEHVGRLVDSYRLAAAFDVDRHAVETYAANLPLRPAMVDLGQAVATERDLAAFCRSIPLRKGSPLVVVGGPPCQGFSAHRKKDGRPSDARNGLVLAFASIVRALRPDIFVFENVPEVAAKKHWDGFDQLRTMLQREGYFTRAQIHNLAGFGVPQERFRTIVMGSLSPFRMPEPFLIKPDYRTVRDAIGALPPVLPGQRGSDSMHYCTRHRASTIATIKKVPRNGGSRPKGVGPRCLDAVDGFRDVYGRMRWDRAANTITSYARNPASGRYVHPEQHRGLTIREAALLQGFPAAVVFEGPFDDKFVQIGNAVPPVFAAFLAAHVLGELGATREMAAAVNDGAEDLLEPTSNSFSSGIAGRKKAEVRFR